MKPTIKYYLNGEYHYATVKDIGDIDELKTSVKTDLVGAINSVIGSTGGGGEIPEDLQDRLDKMESDIDSMKDSGLNSKELEELEGIIEEARDKIMSELDEIAQELEDSYDEKIKDVSDIYDEKVSEINTDIDGVKTNLKKAEGDLVELGEDLSNTKLNVSETTKELNSLGEVVGRKVDKTDFDLLEATVSKHSTSIKQTEEELSAKASQKDLDLATGRIRDAEAEIKINAEGLATTVKRDELRKELDNISIYGLNLLRNTRDWSDWEANTPSRAYLLGNTYNHFHIQEQVGSNSYMSVTIDNLKVGETYTAQINAKSDNNKARPILSVGGESYAMEDDNGDTLLSDSWKIISTKFVAESEESTVYFTVLDVDSSAKTHFAGAKIEEGLELTGWRAHEDDVYEKLITAESDIKQHADQITSVVNKQEKLGEDIESNTTEINQLSNQIELNVKKLSEVDGELQEQKASININANNILSKVEQTDIDKSIGDISISNRNLVLNSNFILDKESWSNINDGFEIKRVNESNFISISREGLSNNIVASASSNMFAAKNGDRLSLGLDVIVEDIGKLDVKTVFALDLFDINDNRVHYEEFDIEDMDGELESGEQGRLTTRYTINREDVAKGRVRVVLYRNGSIAFTNITVEKGDIKSVGWNPAPEDSQMIQAKMQTSINQNAKDISLKAESSVVDKLSGDLKDNQSELKIASDKIQANVTEISKMGEEISEQGTKIEANTEAISLKAESSVVDKLGKDVESNKAELKVASDKITANIESISKNENKLSDHSAKIEANAKEIKTKVTSVEVDSILETKKYATQSELNQKATEINATVSSIEKGVSDVVLTDKTEILSGNPIYTDKADDESVVHVEMDGKSIHQVPVGQGRNLVLDDYSPTSGVQLTKLGDNSFKATSKPGLSWARVHNYSSRIIAWEVGEKYTLSFEAKGNKKYSTYLQIADGNSQSRLIRYDLSVTEVYTKHTLQVTYNGQLSPNSSIQFFLESADPTIDSRELEVRHIKLEKGDTATPYSPAPEDIEDNLQSVNGIDIVSQAGGGRNLAKIDDFRHWGDGSYTLENGIFTLNRKRQGIRVPNEDIKPNTNYTLSFKTKKISGTVKNIGFHAGLSGNNYNLYIDGNLVGISNNYPSDEDEHFFEMNFTTGDSITDWQYIQPNRSSYDEDYVMEIWDIKLEKGNKANSYSPAPEDVPYDTLENNLYKTKLELEEPLRSVGGVKDRLFRDGDGLWKIERNVGERVLDGRRNYVVRVNNNSNYSSYYFSDIEVAIRGELLSSYYPERDATGGYASREGQWIAPYTDTTASIMITDYSMTREEFQNKLKENPVIVYFEYKDGYQKTETLPQDLQNKLNNIASFSKGNSVYTILPDKSDILQSKLQPELHATFKSKGWYRNFVTERKIIEVDLSSKEAIKSDINQLKSEKRRIDAQYTVVYDNEDLSEEVKPKLYDAKRALNGAYDILIANMVKVAEVAAGVTPSDKDREAVQSAFNDYSDKIDKYEGMIQNAIDSISGTRFETVDGELAKVEKRVTTAESKITDDAIRNTVTSHTTFKNVQKDAEKAKNTLDSKSKTWDGKAETSYVDSKANSAETSAKNYTDKELSPVIDRVKTAEQKITDDAIRSTVTSHSTFQNVKKTADDAKKTLDSKSKSWDGKAEPSYVDSKASSAESSAKSHADNKASSAERNAKNYADDALSPVIERVETAESKITKNAIVNTVRESTKYIDDLTGKVSTNEIISRINQTAEKISIDAKKIDLNGAVTISSFGSGLKNDFNAKASKSEAQNYASNAENSAKSYVDDLEIGGRNIIKKSNDFRAGRGDAGITSRITSKGYLEVKNTSSDSNWFTEFLKTNSGIEDSFSEGEVFTISLTMKSPDHIKIPTIYLKNGMGYYELKGEMKKEFSTFYYTGKWKKGSELSFHFGFSGVVGTTIVKDIKLEKGTKATDWTPAPEDVDERVSSVEGSINNAVTTIDGDGVTVKDGSFFLEDDKSDTRYSILQGANLLQDHSFELTKYQLSGSAPRFDSKGYFYAEPSKNAPANWANTGTPRLFPGLGGSLRQHPRMFGRMAGVVNSTNYFYQWVEMPDVSGASIYTLSAYFRTSAHSSSGTPRFRVRVGDGDSNKWSGWETRNFSTVNDNSGMVRHSLTFDYEAMRRASGTSYGGHIEVQIMSASANWIMVDGVQLIEGHYPMNYNPEESLFNFMNGVNGTIGSEIVTEGLRVIGEQNIVRSGSNSNGRWIQFADGTMICTIEITRRANSSLARGAVYVEVDPYIWTFPARFYSSPVVSLNSKVWALLGGYVGDSDNSSSRHRVITHNSSTNVNATYSLIAIGRWE